MLLAVLALCLGASTFTLTGCAEEKSKTSIPNTPEGRKSFMADPSKMPPEARKKMEEAMKAGGADPRSRGTNPEAPKSAN